MRTQDISEAAPVADDNLRLPERVEDLNLKSSSLSLRLNDSMQPLSHGEPGATKSVVARGRRASFSPSWPRTRGCAYAYRVDAEREALDDVVDEVDVARLVVAPIDAHSPDAVRVASSRTANRQLDGTAPSTILP